MAAMPLSVSPTETALRWAAALAAESSRPDTVDGADLLVGALLAQPDRDGEVSQLLKHFGLTGRDLLPDDYPPLTKDSLLRVARQASVAEPTLSGPSLDILSLAQSYARNQPAQIVHLLAGLLLAPSNITPGLTKGLANSGVALTVLADRYASEFLDTSPTTGKVAGTELRAWLTRAFPRQPVNLPRFSSDTINETRDLVGVSREADAFAYLLASRDLVPPLAVGLFGNWGSGKSFLMTKIRTRIAQLCELARSSNRTDLGVWQEVVAINFNAWEYAETNLWAALLDRIFDTLSPEVRQRLAARAGGKLDGQIEAKRSEVEELEASVRDLKEREAKQINHLEATQRTEHELKASAPRRVKELVTAASSADARDATLAIIADGDRLLGPGGTQLIAEIARTHRLLRSPLLSKEFWNGRRIWFTILAAMVVPVLAWAITLLPVPPLVAVLGGASALIPLAATGLKWAGDWLSEQEKAWADHQKDALDKVAASLEEARGNVTAAELELAETREALDQPNAELAANQQALVELQDKRARLTPGTELTAWFHGRAESDDYRRHLTLISTVHDDLQKLEELSLEYNRDQLLAVPTAGSQPADRSKPPNRIVLYIDDLDRCPPAKVVQVLEAVHLLLAFKLFVVVVAVDTRWLRSALTDQLAALSGSPDAPDDHPSPNDYLEKIFQLPFWVDEIDSSARESMLRGLFLDTVAAPSTPPGGSASALRVGPEEEDVAKVMLTLYGSWLMVDTHPLSITPAELTFLQSLAPLLGGTPRRVKRFVNVCQFLLAMAPRLDDVPASPAEPMTTERMATCFMAALHDGLPEVSATIHAAAATGCLTLTQVLPARVPDPSAQEQVVLDWLTEVQPRQWNWGTVTVQRLLVRFDVIKRMRFDAP